MPPIVLCHDLGANKAAVLNVAIALSRAGGSVLLFDFRGHGESDGGRSTLSVIGDMRPDPDPKGRKGRRRKKNG